MVGIEIETSAASSLFSLSSLVNNNSYGVIATALSTLFCFMLSTALKNAGSLIPLRARKNDYEIWYWSSYIVSFVHAAIVGIIAFVCACFDRKLLFEIDHFNIYSYGAICFSTGYFIYDLIDEIQHRKVASVEQYVIHHILVLIVLLPCMLSQRCTGIATTGLITEFHNVFLHSRIILTFYGYDQDQLLKNSLGIANLLTCIVFRLLLFPWIAYVIATSSMSTPVVIIFYLELVYIFIYSLYIFRLSLRTDFPSLKAC